MAQPVFPASVAYGYDKSTVEEFTPSQTAGETFMPGDVVTLNAGVVKLAGADPTAILGLSQVDSEAARVLTADGKIPILVLNSETVVEMCSDTVPVEATHLGNQYGIVNNGGVWKVDTTDVTNKRVEVVRLNVAEGLWFVKFIAANLQGSTVVS